MNRDYSNNNLLNKIAKNVGSELAERIWDNNLLLNLIANNTEGGSGKGGTITIDDDGNVTAKDGDKTAELYVKDSAKPLEVNELTVNNLTFQDENVQKMEIMAVDEEGNDHKYVFLGWEEVLRPEKNQIWYTSTDGQIVTPFDASAFGEASIVSNEYVGNKGVITFDKDVTQFGKDAFVTRGTLQSINIPNSVTSIGLTAFDRCSGLTEIVIPNSVTSIGEKAFSRCSSLTSVTIPDSVTSIGIYAFQNCGSLTSVTIPNSITTIEMGTFNSCRSFTEVVIPDSVTTIKGGVNDAQGAFATCNSVTSVTIGSGVTSIGSWTFGTGTRFDGNKLNSITFKSNVCPTIDYSAFQNVKSNGKIYIPLTADKTSFENESHIQALISSGWTIVQQ